MKKEFIRLSAENTEVTLTAYYEDSDTPRDAILVIPGGAYARVCEDREGGPIAMAFLSRGVNAFVLNYRVAPNRYPSPLIDATLGMSYIRANAEKYSISPQRVFVVGFSAGGHLAGLLSTKHTVGEKLLNLPENSTRPSGTIYAYAVSSAYYQPHCYSFECLTGIPFEELSDECKGAISIDMNVTSETPPAFIFHTAEDEVVSSVGSLSLCGAYLKAGVPVSLHIYPYGPHGIALANEATKFDNEAWVQPLAESWVDDAISFFKTI